MCRKGWAEVGTGATGRGAPLSLPGAAGALPGEGELFFGGGKCLPSQQVCTGGRRILDLKSFSLFLVPFPGHFWSLSQAAAVKFRGAGCLC